MEREKKNDKRGAFLAFAFIVAAFVAALFLMRDDDTAKRSVASARPPAASPIPAAPVPQADAPYQEAPIAQAPASEAPLPEGETDVVADPMVIEAAASPSPSPREERKARKSAGVRRVAMTKEVPASANADADAEVEVAAPAESPAPEAVAAAPASPSPAAEDDDGPRSLVDLQFRENLPWLTATLVDVRIDGKPVIKSENKEGIGSELAWSLSQQQVRSGVRHLDVTVKLVGDSDAFPYLSGYTFTMKKTASIPINGPTVVRLQATPRGNATDDWTKRVNLVFQVERARDLSPAQATR